MKDKNYTIGEVSRLLNVREHTLRHWEKEFPFLSPQKTNKGRRTYQLKDIRLLQKIKELLYQDGYTTKGALKILESNSGDLLLSKEKDEEEKSTAQLFKQEQLKSSNQSSVVQNQSSSSNNLSNDLYHKINKEILLRIYQSVDELIDLWEAFPDE